jgi:hypothetical protein
LYAQQLQRIATIAVDHIALQCAQTGELRACIEGINEDGCQRENQAQEQASGRRRLSGRSFAHAQRITRTDVDGKLKGPVEVKSELFP